MLKQQAERLGCPRCEGWLHLNEFGEPLCRTCCYVNYHYKPDMPIKARGFRGTRYTLRYGGDDKEYAHYRNDLVHITLIPKSRVSNGRTTSMLIWHVECPMCSESVIMEQSALSGKRKDVAEQRFRCYQNHRISVILEDDRQEWW